MIKFWTHPYELSPWNAIGAVSDGSPKKGSLLKVQWPNGNVGYADIFPWVELGDQPVEHHISELAKGRLTPLVEQSIWLAKKDAALRKQGKNAFAGTAKIKNHFLINDFTKFADSQMKEVRDAGFTTVKVKVGRSVDEEGKFITRILKQNPVLIRLDFNGKTNFSEFERLFSHLGPSERARIEFAEDPVPWNYEEWKEASSIIPLAIDMELPKVGWEKMPAGKPPFSVVILKPARVDIEKTLHWINKYALKMVVTSSLDHAVGVAHSLAVAGELKKYYPNTLLECGCLSNKAYKMDEFSMLIQTTGPYLKDIPGTGIGFNDLLEKIEWIPVKA